MTNVKPTLPHEVASAIESMRKSGYDNFTILHQVDGAIIESPALILQRYAFEGEHGGTPDLLMSALINGYEVEQSTEDKLRIAYNAHEKVVKWYQGKIELDQSELKQERYSNGFINGAKAVAEAYGIKIDGINA